MDRAKRAAGAAGRALASGADRIRRGVEGRMSRRRRRRRTAATERRRGNERTGRGRRRQGRGRALDGPTRSSSARASFASRLMPIASNSAIACELLVAFVVAPDAFSALPQSRSTRARYGLPPISSNCESRRVRSQPASDRVAARRAGLRASSLGALPVDGRLAHLSPKERASSSASSNVMRSGAELTQMCRVEPHAAPQLLA